MGAAIFLTVSFAHAEPVTLAVNSGWTTFRDSTGGTQVCGIQTSASGGHFTLFGSTDRPGVLRLSFWKDAWNFAATPAKFVITFTDGTAFHLEGREDANKIRADIPAGDARSFVHHLTADASATVAFANALEPPWPVNLSGSTPATLALEPCINAAQIILPPPFRSPSSANEAAAAVGAVDGGVAHTDQASNSEAAKTAVDQQATHEKTPAGGLGQWIAGPTLPSVDSPRERKPIASPDASSGNARLSPETDMLFVVLAFVAFVVTLVLTSVKIVSQTENFLIERLGKYNRTLAAGVHIIVPFWERVAHRESILERQLPAKEVPAFTKDNVQITMTLAILYRVMDASRAWYRIKNIDQAIETVIIGVVRSTIGASDLDQVQSNRSHLSNAIASEVQHVTDEWGINVTRVEIVDVEVDAATRTAMQRQLNAERNRRALVTEAEGKRQAANLEADAGLYTAEQQAQAQRVLADAQAYAVQTVAQAINNNGEAAINFDIKKIQADAIKTLASQPGSKVVLLPADILETLSSVTSRIVGR